jgi:hypothetical protein
MTWLALPCILLFGSILMAADPPKAEISNGQVKATLYLPDANDGYYRGTRFDWSGVIPSLDYKGHSYFGQWFPKYDAKLHDAIMGPVEEFLSGNSAVGYEEAKVGGTFVRIGVGVLRKPEETEFHRFNTYEIVDGGKWTIHKKSDAVEFSHELKDAADGYAYQYQKVVRISKDKPELILEHTLKNTGKKVIDTDVYNHNFFIIDGEPTGPGLTVKFPFQLEASGKLGGIVQVKGSQLTYSRPQQGGDTVMAEFKGFGPTAADYNIQIENSKSGAGVHIVGDQPLMKVLFWSIPTVLAPEPYIHMTIESGQQFQWKIVYQFYAKN